MTLIHNVVGTPQAARALLLIHGYGADERDLGGLLPYLDPEGRFLTVLPRGPMATPPGFSWYDITSLDPSAPSGSQPNPTLLSSLDALDELLDEVCASHDKQRGEAVVAGFSQGAALAVALAYRRSDRPHPAGVIAMSGYLPEVDGLDYAWDAAPDIPALVLHGTEDPLLPVARGRALAEMLERHGAPVTYAEFPIEHQVALESVQQAHDWLLAVAAGEQPRAAMPEAGPEPLVTPMTTARWHAEVLTSEIPVIVDFWAPWCGPCRQVSPIVEQIAAMRGGAYKVVKVNIDEEPKLAQEYGVQSIPMIGLFRNGKLERSTLGAKPRQQIEAELGMLVIP